MARAEKTVDIERPVHEVFEFVIAGENNPKWRPGILEIQRIGEDPPGMGVRYHQVMKGPLGQRIHADYEITEFEPDKRMGFRVTSGPLNSPTGLFEFMNLVGATRLKFALEYEPSGLSRLIEIAIFKQMEVEVDHILTLKKELEGIE